MPWTVQQWWQQPRSPPRSCSVHSLASDPVLSFVTSYLGTRASTASRPEGQEPLAIASGGTGTSSTGGSGAIELRTDARLWEVQWPELTLLRLLGRGSFGSVYLAEWNQIPVAVKVLVSQGE